MRIIKRIEVTASLRTAEADLFHDLNELIDAINGHHSQRMKWLEDDRLQHQKTLSPTDYSDQKLVSLLVKRQAANRQLAISIVSDPSSLAHKEFFNKFNDSNATAKLQQLKSSTISAKRDLFLLNKELDLMVIQHESLDIALTSLEERLRNTDERLKRYEGDAEKTAKYSKRMEKLIAEHAGLVATMVDLEYSYKTTVENVSALQNKLAADEKETQALNAKLKKLNQFKTEANNLIEKVRPYAHLLHLSAVELAIVARLTDKLALATGIAIKAASTHVKAYSSATLTQLKDLNAAVQALRTSIIDYMKTFDKINVDHRETLINIGVIDARGERLDKTKQVTDLDPLDIPELKTLKFKLTHQIPKYIDPMHFIKCILNDLSHTPLFEDADIMPDVSINDATPSRLLRNNEELDSEITIRKYFKWYCDLVESGTLVEAIQCEIDETPVENLREAGQLEFLVDNHNERHSPVSDILHLVRDFLHNLYDDMSIRWKDEFRNACRNIKISDPITQATPIVPIQVIPTPIAASNAAESSSDRAHDWEIIPSPRRQVLQNKENHRNIFLYEITQLLEDLTQEIHRCKQLAKLAVTDFFKKPVQNKIANKEAKKESLEQLLQAATFDDLARGAAQLLTKPHVTEGITSRTHALLMDITDKAQNHQTLQPVK